MTFGEACREVRVARKLSQIRVAEAADIHQSRVSEIERDAYSPGLDQARKLANGLGVNLSDMIAICEGLLTVEDLVAAVDGPDGTGFVAQRRKSQAPGKDMAERAQRLGYEVLRVVDTVMHARLESERRGRQRSGRKKS